MDLRDYLRTLRKRWLIVALCAVASLGAAAGASALTTPMYEARTQLFVSAQNSKEDISGAYQGGLFTQQRVKSYADIVNSPTVTEAVVRELRLDMPADQLARQISAAVPLDTVLINITVRDEMPHRARDIANAVAREFARLVPELETPSGTTQAPVKVSVVKPADLPTTPSSPRVKVNLALGLLVGVALGVGLAVLRETLDTSVKGSSDLQDLVGAKPLGAIIEDPDAGKRPLVVQHDPHSMRAEAFRQLRTNLQYVDVDHPPRSVVVTSAVSDEGKSLICCNLAITVAHAGARVALVEADLRRPKVADYFGLEGAVGLTTVLTGEVPLELALQEWGRVGLSILPGGALPPNPSEILGSQAMQDLLRRLEGMFDLVVIDAPPLLPVTDPAIVARHSSGAVLVVRHGKTRREQVARAAELLLNVDARLLGTVLNRVPTKGAEAHRYGYAYGAYYRSAEDRPRMKDEADVPTRAAAFAQTTSTGRRRRVERDSAPL